MTRTCPGVLLSVLLSGLVGTSVGCASSWPAAVSASGDARFFAGNARVRTIDIMPSDVQVWAGSGEKTPEQQIGAGLDSQVAGALPGLLAEKGYQVVANLDWEGRYIADDGQRRAALEKQQMIETAWALSSYGAATERARRQGLVPHLPHRLGAATGSDATLYVGGWAYAGKKRRSTGDKVLMVVGVALVAVVVVVVVAAVLDGKGGKIGSAAGSVAKGVGKAGAKAARGAARVAGGIGRAAIRVGSSATRVMARAATSIDTIEIHFATGDRDCFGRVDTHTAWYQGRPDFYADERTPSSGPSEAMIEMTLVDNRTGVALWHARQRFPADPKNPKDIAKMMESMTAALPLVSTSPAAFASR